MKINIRQLLNNLVKENGYVTLNQVYKFAADNGFKQKTAERELNLSRSPQIDTIKNEKHQIIGYRYKPTPSLKPNDYYFSKQYYEDKNKPTKVEAQLF